MGDDTKTKEESEQARMMEVYRKLGTPGKPHEALTEMTGNWHTLTQHFMTPGQPPVESEGTCEQTMLLGGRYLQQEFHGDMMGAPFSGIGITGFDNQSQKYVSTWIDSMSTRIFYFEGTADADSRIITQECRSEDPIKGPMTWRSVTRVVDRDTHTFEMYGTDKSGREEKMMAIRYTRK
jgi:hypothetical protein